MAEADDVDLVAPGLFLWHAYDAKIKAELFATAFDSDAGRYLVDPIPLRAQALDELAAGAKIVGVIITNENHHRASSEFGARFGVGISDAASKIDNDIQVISIAGAAPGEIALCVRGTLIVGDALINFEPYGFSFLPAKYCEDAKVMRRSLGQLLELDFSRILFAHGHPITTNAHERLAHLLADAK